ncbi:MAG: hypothetical protein J7556_11895 [Acidovorax sp.]|nr:hypothetical protein [Acidovorax sp.]
MVYFVLTRRGYERLVDALLCVPSPLWVNQGVLSPEELAGLRAIGISVTDFTHAIDPADCAQVADATHTVCDHHPGQLVWVECMASAPSGV